MREEDKDIGYRKASKSLRDKSAYSARLGRIEESSKLVLK